MVIQSVGRCAKNYLCKVSTLKLHKQKNYRAKFQTQYPLWEKETKENAIQINQISIHLLNE